MVSLPDSGRPEFYLHPAVVRRNDTSAKSINEWTGEKILNDADVADDVAPASVQPLGNYAVQISWQDGLNQVLTDYSSCLIDTPQNMYFSCTTLDSLSLSGAFRSH